MSQGLEVCLERDEIYLGSDRASNPFRPIFTGDIFEVDGDRRVMVVEHPCAMRAGSRVADTVLVAPIASHNSMNHQRWSDGYYDKFPLPELDGEGTFFAASFNQFERCSTDMLTSANRLACFLPLGVNMLQHRLVWYLTRCHVSTAKFDDAFACYYEEADIIEEWVEEAASRQVDENLALDDIEAALGEIGDGAQSFREMLRDAQRRSFVRRTMRQRAKDRYAG
jgi:hypothetical protein